MRRSNRSLCVLVAGAGVWLLASAATAQNAQPAAGGSAPAGAPPAGDGNVVTRTYNVGDLFRPTHDYPFDSAIVPPTQLGVPQEEPPSAPPPAGGVGTPAGLRPGGRAGGGRGAGGGWAGALIGGQPAPPPAGPPTEGIDGLIRLLVTVIDPSSWADNGGNVGVLTQFGNLLIITQTNENQKKVANLLAEIRKEVGPTRMVTIRADWVLVGPDELKSLLKGGAGDSARDAGREANRDANRDAGQNGAGTVLQEVNPSALANLGGKTVHFRAQMTGFNGQTIHVTSGRGRTVVTGADASVGTSAVATTPRTALVQAGALLQTTPSLAPDGKSVVLDVRSVVSDWSPAGAPINSPATAVVAAKEGATAAKEGTSPAAGREQNATVDRLNVLAQQLRTTLRVPLGRPVLVGGMTLEPTPENPDAKQLYLIVEVTASE